MTIEALSKFDRAKVLVEPVSVDFPFLPFVFFSVGQIEFRTFEPHVQKEHTPFVITKSISHIAYRKKQYSIVIHARAR